MKTKISFVFFFILPFCLFAQQNNQANRAQIQRQLANTRPLFCDSLATVADKAMSPSWLKFKEGVLFQSADALQSLLPKFELSSASDLYLYNVINKPELNTSVYVYHQRYAGFKIEDAQLNLHTKAKQASKANGMLVRGELNQKPILINEQQAIAIAQQSFNDKKGYLHGTVEKVWARPDLDAVNTDNSAYTLCYAIEIKHLNKGFRFYVDCNSGAVVYAVKTVLDCVSSTNSTLWYGNKTIKSKYNSGSATYQLINDCNPTNIVILDRTDSNSYNLYTYSSTSQFQTHLSTAAYVAERSYVYFKNVHGREGQRGDSTTMVLLVDNPGTCPGCTGANAYAGDTITFGNYGTATTTDDYQTLDVVGHEMTHMVTATNGSGGLLYSSESGALNESFSDIFGNLVEMYTEGYSDTGAVWRMGEDRYDGTGTLWLRDTRDPNLKNANTWQSGNDPKYYLGTYWKPTNVTCGPSNDGCGVHSNSGVQNYFFYLLTTGSNGVGGVSFSGLGMATARAIAYQALTGGYLTYTSNYVNARDVWVNAAVDLYGNCSIQAITVGKAWEAVGVGSYFYYGNNICGTYGAGVSNNQSNNAYFLSPSNCGMTITGTGNKVTYDGGYMIEITPGFNTNTGANFEAKVNDCWYSNY